MGHQDTPTIANTELPPASYYEPYPAVPDARRQFQQDTNSRVALQQNDKSGMEAIPISLLGRYQAPVECPACSRRTVTSVKHKNGKAAQSVLPIFFVTRNLKLLREMRSLHADVR
ncbi:uncharacterized protein PAC_08584 [Phialocephala subalpina]|uniref:Uncharacterized protein n=1 Tax=Phialocephala subalpina TaxID=576137 RepID=A0A1L7X101_9HELO|nr:uncharacterized protein PAC_08584 [Phialocephala subalpina]